MFDITRIAVSLQLRQSIFDLDDISTASGRRSVLADRGRINDIGRAIFKTKRLKLTSLGADPTGLPGPPNFQRIEVQRPTIEPLSLSLNDVTDRTVKIVRIPLSRYSTSPTACYNPLPSSPISTFPCLRRRRVSSYILSYCGSEYEPNLLNNVVKKKAPDAGQPQRGRKFWMSDRCRPRGFR